MGCPAVCEQSDRSPAHACVGCELAAALADSMIEQWFSSWLITFGDEVRAPICIVLLMSNNMLPAMVLASFSFWGAKAFSA